MNSLGESILNTISRKRLRATASITNVRLIQTNLSDSSGATETNLDEEFSSKNGNSMKLDATPWTKKEVEDLERSLQPGITPNWIYLVARFPGRSLNAIKAMGDIIREDRTKGVVTSRDMAFVNVAAPNNEIEVGDDGGEEFHGDESDTAINAAHTMEEEEGTHRSKKPRRVQLWTPEEDEHLISLRRADPHLTWNEIAANFTGRTMKAVKDRYFVHLRRSKLEMSQVDTSSPPTGGEEDEAVIATTIATGKSPIIILPTPPLSTLWTKEEDEKMLRALLRQRKRSQHRSSPQVSWSWGPIQDLFPHRTPGATAVHGHKLLKDRFGTVRFDLVPLPADDEGVEENEEEEMEGQAASNHESNREAYSVITRWTEEEDQKLMALINAHPHKRRRRWDQLALHFPDRKIASVRNRGLKLLGNLARFEDTNTATVAPEASSANVTAPLISDAATAGGADTLKKINLWTEEEEEQLLAAMATHNTQWRRWSAVASHFPHRSLSAVETRGVDLCKLLHEEYQRLALLHSSSSTASESATMLATRSDASNGTSSQTTDCAGTSMELRNGDDEDVKNDGDTGEDDEDDIERALSLTQEDTTVNLSTRSICRRICAMPLQENIQLLRRLRTERPPGLVRSFIWSPEEDELLQRAMAELGSGGGGVHQWTKVAEIVSTKSARQCLSRWHSLNPEINHGLWTHVEDELLRHAVQVQQQLQQPLWSEGDVQHGKLHWAKVAALVPGRIGAQCRARWYNKLNPDLNTKPWTLEDDRCLLVHKHALGNRWVEIEKRSQARSTNSLVSRWSSIKRRLEHFLLFKRGWTKREVEEKFAPYDFDTFYSSLPLTAEDFDEIVELFRPRGSSQQSQVRIQEEPDEMSGDAD